MNQHIGKLAVLLVVQIVIIVGFWLAEEDDLGAETAFLPLVASDVHRIRMEDGESAVALVREPTGWRVGETPADQALVGRFVDKLVNLQASWPAASTQASQQRFEVADEAYQRKISLTLQDSTEHTVYLGTSPGFEKVHARLGGQQEIYSVGLSNYEIAVTQDHWMDKQLLATKAAPNRVEVSFSDEARTSKVLELTNAGWQIDGQNADPNLADIYAKRFTTLRVLGLATEDLSADPVATLDLIVEGVASRLVLTKQSDTDEYVVQFAGDPKRYRFSSYVAEQLMMTDTDFLPTASDETPELP